MKKFGNSLVEMFLGKTLNINDNLEGFQKSKLIKMLQKHSSASAWKYTDMKGIDLNTCMHHIYIKENGKLFIQP